jgi:lipoate-protein ligase B
VLLLEHFPVFTLGNRGGKEFLQLPEEELIQKGISVVPTRRGGYITYHAQGQLVIYPIISLQEIKKGVAAYVNQLEEIMIQIGAYFNVPVHRHPTRPGAWIQEQKIGSIGVAISKGITMHGLAFNVNLDLSPFSWISPCGFSDVQMTSLAEYKKEAVSMEEVRKIAKKIIADVFTVSWEKEE